MNSNPIPGQILGELKFNADQISEIQRSFEIQISERAGTSQTAVLSAPVNIGIGTK
jgi:hypothetical protein